MFDFNLVRFQSSSFMLKNATCESVHDKIIFKILKLNIKTNMICQI